MNILHVFKSTNDKFYIPFIDFINETFDSKDHNFFIEIYNVDYVIFERKNIEHIIKKQYFKLISEMYKSDKIILHGLMSPRINILLFLQPWLLKKCYWVVWGGDLYYYREQKNTFRKKIHEFMRKFIIKNMGNICTLVKGDYELVKEWYKVKGKYFGARYMDNKAIEWRNRITSNPNYLGLKSNKLKVLVGNSATFTNNHIEVFNILKKFKNENIEIICPLSYGDMEYAKEVKKHGRDIFKNKFTSLEEFITLEKYIKFLSKIDIGIFNNDRQQALGNIFSLIELGKKVYMKNYTAIWNEIINYKQLVVFDIKEIEGIDFAKFKRLDNAIVEENMKKCKEINSSSHAKEIWAKIFQS